ncbi:hypothetical protein Ahy_B10g104385 [Arachis hypogaea]|uniref:Uncharacterized protein n=1 Tax=Arachis hypogaea TaxID=3818 RepID=A0A444X5L5_ARAHY|nr:hypothetical protein Ahy_B10g104385 [Arachis hypogaea]
MIADHETKFKYLARQVERIARIVDYDEGGRRNGEVDPEDLGNTLRNRDDNINLGGDVNHVVRHGQNADEVLARMHVNQRGEHYQDSSSRNSSKKKEKEKLRNEKKYNSKFFARKEKVSYVEMGSSSEESDVEFSEVYLVELKKGPPYICSLLKKIANVEKSNDLKYKSGKRDFETNVRAVYPDLGEGLLEFLMQ